MEQTRCYISGRRGLMKLVSVSASSERLVRRCISCNAFCIYNTDDRSIYELCAFFCSSRLIFSASSRSFSS